MLPGQLAQVEVSLKRDSWGSFRFTSVHSCPSLFPPHAEPADPRADRAQLRDTITAWRAQIFHPVLPRQSWNLQVTPRRKSGVPSPLEIPPGSQIHHRGQQRVRRSHSIYQVHHRGQQRVRRSHSDFFLFLNHWFWNIRWGKKWQHVRTETE